MDADNMRVENGKLLADIVWWPACHEGDVIKDPALDITIGTQGKVFASGIFDTTAYPIVIMPGGQTRRTFVFTIGRDTVAVGEWESGLPGMGEVGPGPAKATRSDRQGPVNPDLFPVDAAPPLESEGPGSAANPESLARGAVEWHALATGPAGAHPDLDGHWTTALAARRMAPVSGEAEANGDIGSFIEAWDGFTTLVKRRHSAYLTWASPWCEDTTTAPPSPTETRSLLTLSGIPANPDTREGARAWCEANDLNPDECAPIHLSRDTIDSAFCSGQFPKN